MWLKTRIANSLRENLSRYGERLPPLAVLCDQFGVSLVTMHAAVRILEREGLVSCRKGRRAKVCRNTEQSVAPAEQRGKGVDTVCMHIRELIDDGDLRGGQALPKIYVITRLLGVSNRTVSRAYDSLIHERLVYRRGRSWIVGRRQEPVQARHRDQAPVIALIDFQEGVWLRQSGGGYSGEFYRAFRHEAEVRGIRVMPAFYERTDSDTGLFPANFDETKHFIRGLGDHYRGALIAFGPVQVDRFSEIAGEIRMLGGSVVWHDRHDAGWPGNRRARNVRRFRANRLDAAALAFSFLRQMGHRRVIAPLFWPDAGWRSQFAGQIRGVARDRGIELIIVQNPAIRKPWDAAARALARSGFEKLDSDGTPRAKKLMALRRPWECLDQIRQLFFHADGEPRELPSRDLTSLFRLSVSEMSGLDEDRRDLGALLFASTLLSEPRASGCTAILGPTEFDSYHFLVYLKLVGWQAPKTYSLISLQNIQTPIPYILPVTTVNLGGDRLGCMALESVLGELSINAARQSDIHARPFITRRGSVLSLRHG